MEVAYGRKSEPLRDLSHSLPVGADSGHKRNGPSLGRDTPNQKVVGLRPNQDIWFLKQGGTLLEDFLHTAVYVVILPRKKKLVFKKKMKPNQSCDV